VNSGQRDSGACHLDQGMSTVPSASARMGETRAGTQGGKFAEVAKRFVNVGFSERVGKCSATRAARIGSGGRYLVIGDHYGRNR